MIDNGIVIRTQDLTKRYKTITAVDGLSMEVYCGEVFGFLGPNGAGKTTTISMLLGRAFLKSVDYDLVSVF